jgi:hypothetical protein
MIRDSQLKTRFRLKMAGKYLWYLTILAVHSLCSTLDSKLWTAKLAKSTRLWIPRGRKWTSTPIGSELR